MRKSRKTASDTLHNSIHAIYQQQALDYLLWGFVTGLSTADVSKTEAVKRFKERFNLDEDSCPTGNMLMKYWRMNNLMFNANQTLGRCFVSVPREDLSGLSQIAPILEEFSYLVEQVREEQKQLQLSRSISLFDQKK